MSIVNSQIYSNTDDSVRTHVQKFPSPRWENCAPMGDSRFARCLQGGGVYVNGGTVSIVNSEIYSNTNTYVRTVSRNFPSPRGRVADVLASTLACTTANASVNYSMCVLQRP